MPITKIKEVLIELGLTETESKVYLAMLELGPNSVQNIAKKAEISRTACYEIISSLQGKGLASTFNKGKKKFFSAEDPDQLQRYFKNRVQEMRGQLGSLRSLLPELRLKQAGDRPRVRYYTGADGLRALYRDVESVRVDEIFEMVDMEKTYAALDEQAVIKMRSSSTIKKISAKVLHRGEVRNPRPNSKYRHIQESSIDFDGIIWIYKNRVAFINLHIDIESVIVESAVFSQSMKALFLAAWANATPTKFSKNK